MPHRIYKRIDEGRDSREPSQLPQLADSDLSPEAAAAAYTVDLALIRPLAHRAVSVFLQNDQFENLNFKFDKLMARILMECLQPYIHTAGGEVVKVINFESDAGCNTSACSADVNADGNFLLEGHMFIYFANERVVVSISQGFGPAEFTIRLCSTGDARTFFNKWESYARAHNSLRGRSFFADGKLIKRENRYSSDSIVMPKDTRETIRMHVEAFLQNLETLKQYNVKQRRGLILAGEPGTGKTLLGKVLADTLNVSFIWALPRHIRTADSFSELLSLANFVAPTVLFLEDVDLYAEDREAKGWLGLGELMNQLDGVLDNEGVITIATTNRLAVIESALRNRPGRFDRVVIFEAMDENCRRVMVERLLSKAAVSRDDVEHLVSATEACTGAQIEEISNTIYISAVSQAAEHGIELAGKAVPVDRSSIDTAIAQVVCNRNSELGFNAE